MITVQIKEDEAMPRRICNAYGKEKDVREICSNGHFICKDHV